MYYYYVYSNQKPGINKLNLVLYENYFTERIINVIN